MRFLFVIQSEGKGHITQALALRDMLEKQGHIIVGVLIGKNTGYPIPESFLKSFTCPVVRYPATHMVLKKGTNRLAPFRTAAKTFTKNHFYDIPKFIAQEAKKYHPDIIVNFYEFMFGLAETIFKTKIPIVAVANMFATESHLRLIYPEDFFLQFFNRINRMGAKEIVGLCLTPEQSRQSTRFHLLAPLLRAEIRNLPVQKEKEDFYLVYVKNENVIPKLFEKIKDFPETKWRIVVAHPEKYPVVPDRVTIESINPERFITLLSQARGVIGNAGFDLICEAAYFHVPILTLPIERLVEQEINAKEAQKAGIGVYAKKCDIQKLLDFEKEYSFDSASYRRWIAGQDEQWEKLWKKTIQSD